MSIEKLTLSNTFKAVMDKINQIINTINGTEEGFQTVRIKSADGAEYIDLTFDGGNLKYKKNDGTEGTVTLQQEQP